jgi:CBS domain-containing protein
MLLTSPNDPALARFKEDEQCFADQLWIFGVEGRDMTNSIVCKCPASVGEIMTHNPLSIGQRTPLSDAAAFLSKKDISAAPVIDEAGRPMGVLSRTDIVRHLADSASSFSTAGDVVAGEIMNPEVYFVRPDTPVSRAADDLLECGVQRLFVVDSEGALIGTLSIVDLLHHFRRKPARAQSATLLNA